MPKSEPQNLPSYGFTSSLYGDKPKPNGLLVFRFDPATADEMIARLKTAKKHEKYFFAIGGRFQRLPDELGPDDFPAEKP